ncbi:MAG: helix-turn-helix transcriptional regulator [Planctomycetota bacterium]|nr:helix-turn-helix transcriptional regulator [Planctomycetota bacterium]
MDARHAPLSEQVRAAVRGCGLSQCALAKRAGVDRTALCRFLRGERGASLPVLDRLGATLGLVVKVAGPSQRNRAAARRGGQTGNGGGPGGRPPPAAGPGPADLAFMRQFIAACRWQFAETYAKTAPHEYTVRGWLPGPAGQADFEAFVKAIRACGYDRAFRGRTYRTLDVDGQKYWTMGAPVAKTTVINRAPAEPRECAGESKKGG